MNDERAADSGDNHVDTAVIGVQAGFELATIEFLWAVVLSLDQVIPLFRIFFSFFLSFNKLPNFVTLFTRACF